MLSEPLTGILYTNYLELRIFLTKLSDRNTCHGSKFCILFQFILYFLFAARCETQRLVSTIKKMIILLFRIKKTKKKIIRFVVK